MCACIKKQVFLRVLCVFIFQETFIHTTGALTFQTKNARLPILHFLAMPPSGLLRNKETGLGSGVCQHNQSTSRHIRVCYSENKYLKNADYNLVHLSLISHTIIKTNTTFICLDIARERGIYKLITTILPPFKSHLS